MWTKQLTIAFKKFRNYPLTNYGITTDVSVHTIMREVNDNGYWCTLLKDGTSATDYGNYQAAIKQVKLQ